MNTAADILISMAFVALACFPIILVAWWTLAEDGVCDRLSRALHRHRRRRDRMRQ